MTSFTTVSSYVHYTLFLVEVAIRSVLRLLISETVLNCQDGTWSTVEKSCMVVRDVKDVAFHSYFSVMDDLQRKGPPNAKYYEIRFICLSILFILMSLCFLTWRPLVQNLEIISTLSGGKAAYSYPPLTLLSWK